MKTTANEQAAQRAGYPPMLFGFTPNDKYYWSEPGLPWVAAYLNAHPGPMPATWQVVNIATEVMAPRFPNGCSVVVEAVQQGQPLLPGVYIWQTPYKLGYCYIGRLSYTPSETTNALFLDLDNRKTGIICLLDWAHPDFSLWRVTYYSSVLIK